MTAQRLPAAVMAAWLAALVVAGLWLFAQAPADDSYIVARYAQNLWAGHGLTYNVGERINALTSPAGFAVMALLAAVLPDPVRAWQGLAALLAAGSTLALARHTYADALQRLLFLALTLASPFVMLWTVGGLETPLLYAVAGWLAALALAPGPLSARRASAIILLASLAVLTRYDAVLFAGPVALAALWQARRLRPAWIAAGAGGVAVAGWLAFCGFYFGDLLPTPFYVKLQGAAGAGSAALGIEYVLSFAVLAWLPLVFAWSRQPRTVKAAPRMLRASVWMGLALMAIYGVVAGSVHMMYAYRFFVPWLPVLWLCLLPPQRPGSTLRWVGVVLALQAVLLAAMWHLSQNPNLSLAYVPQTPDNERHELSLVGARDGLAVAAAIDAQAAALRADWQARPESATRPPRAAVDTGGRLPFLVPGLYVFDRLVSYRHACPNPAQRAADYWQVFRTRPSGGTPAEPPAAGWSPVTLEILAVTDAHGVAHALEIGLWRQAAPAAPDLPATVNGGCVTPAAVR